MKKQQMAEDLSQEIEVFIKEHQSLNLATVDSEGLPFASYAPYGIGDNCLYVLLSDIAGHSVNLKNHPHASALIVEDEKEADNLFARVRVNLTLNSTVIPFESEGWQEGIDVLSERHGEMIKNLAGHTDFNLFKLTPVKGRYVKGFARAYSFEDSLTGKGISHMTGDGGHKKRESV